VEWDRDVDLAIDRVHLEVDDADGLGLRLANHGGLAVPACLDAVDRDERREDGVDLRAVAALHTGVDLGVDDLVEHGRGERQVQGRGRAAPGRAADLGQAQWRRDGRAITVIALEEGAPVGGLG